MSRFAAVRHPDVATAGVCPEGAYELQRGRGWYRVSEWVEDPGALLLDGFGPDSPDLDAPPKKKSSAKPAATDEEQQA